MKNWKLVASMGPRLLPLAQSVVWVELMLLLALQASLHSYYSLPPMTLKKRGVHTVLRTILFPFRSFGMAQIKSGQFNATRKKVRMKLLRFEMMTHTESR